MPYYDNVGNVSDYRAGWKIQILDFKKIFKPRELYGILWTALDYPSEAISISGFNAHFLM